MYPRDVTANSAAMSWRKSGARVTIQRSFDSSPSYEKYLQRRKKGTPRKKHPTHPEMVRRAHQRIIGAIRKRGNGYIEAMKAKDAVRVLKKWVRNDDGRLGTGKQVFGVLHKAFDDLCRAHVITKRRFGYVLNPHTFIPAA